MARDPLTSRRRRPARDPQARATSRPQRYVIPALLLAVITTGVASLVGRPDGPEPYVPAPGKLAVPLPLSAAGTAPRHSPAGATERPFMDASAEGATAYSAGDPMQRWRISKPLVIPSHSERRARSGFCTLTAVDAGRFYRNSSISVGCAHVAPKACDVQCQGHARTRLHPR